MPIRQVIFQRELGNAVVADYWDVLLAQNDGPLYHLIAITAALLARRSALLHVTALDGLYMISNAMGRGLRLNRLLLDADRLCSRLQNSA